MKNRKKGFEIIPLIIRFMMVSGAAVAVSIYGMFALAETITGSEFDQQFEIELKNNLLGSIPVMSVLTWLVVLFLFWI